MLSVVVIGMGQFGHQISVTLSQLGHEILALDTDADRVDAVKDEVARAARADATQESTLRALGVAECKVAVVALGEADFEAAVLSVAALRELGVATVIARSSSPQRGRILGVVGAHRVVYPELQMADQLAREIVAGRLESGVRLPSGHVLAEVKVPARLFGLTVQAGKIRSESGLNVLGIRRARADSGEPGEPQEVVPELTLEPGDLIIVAGDRRRIQDFGRDG